MLTHEAFKAEMMKRPGVRAEVARLEREEMPILNEILAARKAAGLTQAQVAERMGSTAPAVSRLEDALVTGKHSPSLATLRKYAAALGKRIVCCCMHQKFLGWLKRNRRSNHGFNKIAWVYRKIPC